MHLNHRYEGERRENILTTIELNKFESFPYSPEYSCSPISNQKLLLVGEDACFLNGRRFRTVLEVRVEVGC